MFENIGTQQKEEIIWCQNQKYQTTKFFTENLLVIEIKKSDFFFFSFIYFILKNHRQLYYIYIKTTNIRTTNFG